MSSGVVVLHPKWVVITTFQTFFLAFLFSYFNVDVSEPIIGVAKPMWAHLVHKYEAYISKSEEGEYVGAIQDSIGSKVVMTKTQLAEYKGEKGDKGLYLAVLGRIYDVSKGKQHYGPGGGYHFFAGKDATRAFVSGEFSDSGLVDDVTGFSAQDMLGIEEWIGFYEKQYKFVGLLEGTYYNSKGKETKAVKYVRQQMTEAHKWKEEQEAETSAFPPCNSEWTQNKGGRVWCSDRSGGVKREWVGVPRKMFTPGSSHSRCACIRTTGPAHDNSGGNKGDLASPNLRQYTNCDPKAVSCKVKD